MNTEMNQIIEMMLTDTKVRKSIARENHMLFFSAYFSHYINVEFADFHREMFTLSQDESVRTLVITAARGTGKSTILNMSFAIWAVLGKLEKRFVVITSHTQGKARQHYQNLRKELEENQLLKTDLGPFKEESGEWGSSLVLPHYGARIMFASTEQSVRGMRHKQHRPDLIIGDDLEDNDSVKTLENRNKTYDWLNKDVIPAGDANTKLVVIGTLLHEDSIMMRLKKEIESGARKGVYKEYPLLDDAGHILWPGKFPDEQAIEDERLRTGDEKAWYQEYLLRIISDTDRVIHPEWIQYYTEIPERTSENEYRGTYIGVDLAISEKDHADYTAMVAASVFGWGEEMRIYIRQFPINERMDFPATLQKAKDLSSGLAHDGRKARLYVEDNQYQRALPEMMKKEGYPAEGVTSQGDKRTRLTLVNPVVKNGQVLFPKHGAEHLIQQLIGFGVERHDDLADAFALVVGKISERNHPRPYIPDRMCHNDDDNGPITKGLLNKRF